MGVLVRHVFGAKTMGIVLGDKAGIEIACDKFGVRQQGRLKRDVAGDAANHKAIERLAHFGNRVQAVASVHDQLGDHGIVKHRYLATITHAGVHTHAQQVGGIALEHGLRGWRKAHQATRGWQEVAERVFGIDAALDGPAIALHLRLRERQFLARRHADHQLHQVQAGNRLSHRMLYLQAGVHLKEVKALVLADHKLHRTRALVVHRFSQSHRLLAHGFAGGLADKGRRRLFNHFLVAPLYRAFALVQIQHMAVCVTD